MSVASENGASVLKEMGVYSGLFHKGLNNWYNLAWRIITVCHVKSEASLKTSKYKDEK